MHMKRHFSLRILAAAALAVAALCACSPTRYLDQGEYMLAKNSVKVVNDKNYPKGDLTPYYKQSAQGSRISLNLKKQKPVVLDEGLVEPTCRGMIRHLEYKGYYDSKVDTVITRKKKKAKVKYLVTLGKQFPMKDIQYVVEDDAIRAICAADSAKRTLIIGEPMSEASLESEAERIATLLRSKGYYGYSKNYMFNFADTTSVRDSALLRVELRNYTRNESPTMARKLKPFTVRNVQYEIAPGLNVKPSFVQEINLIERGMLYSEDLVSTTYQRYASNRAFGTVNITLTPVDSTSQVDCTIALSPAKTQNFEVNFDASTNSSGLIGLTPSFTYNHFNAFHGGDVFSLGFRGNFQFKFNDPTRSNEFAITSGLTFPRLLLLPFIHSRTATLPATDIALVYNYQNRPEYTRNILSASYGYSWSASRKLRYSVKVPHLSVIKIFNIDQDFYQSLNSSYLQYQYQNHFDLGTTASIYFTTDPSVNPTRSYFYARGDFSSSGLALNSVKGLWQENRRGQRIIWGIPYSQYLRAQVSMVQTTRFGIEDQLSLATRLLAGVGYAYGNSLFSMPLEQMFYAGGASSMRGWQSRTLGPGNAPLDDTFLIYNQVGEMRLEANFEVRFPVVWKISGALFTDIGNIWNLPKREDFMDEEYELSVFRFNKLAESIGVDWGLGARLDFGLLLIRVDLGLKMYDPASKEWKMPSDWFDRDGCAVHLGIGYPF